MTVFSLENGNRWIDFSQYLVSKGYSYLDDSCLICADKSTVKCEDCLHITGNIFVALNTDTGVLVTFLGDNDKIANDLINSYSVLRR